MTRIYGLVGKKLGHSFSKNYFEEKFLSLQLTHKYTLFELENIQLVKNLLTETEGLAGFNVTIPYKQAVIPFLDGLSADAARAGAVNTVARLPDGRWWGFNTDIIGFRQSLQTWLGGYTPQGALVLGTGGAAQAAQLVLGQLGIPYIEVSRSADATRPQVLTYAGLTEDVIWAHPLIVNCTPAGMYPNTESRPPLPYQYLTSSHWLYDMVYNPLETSYMKAGLAAGARATNGLAMLHGQADAAWQIWQDPEAWL